MHEGNPRSASLLVYETAHKFKKQKEGTDPFEVI